MRSEEGVPKNAHERVLWLSAWHWAALTAYENEWLTAGERDALKELGDDLIRENQLQFPEEA